MHDSSWSRLKRRTVIGCAGVTAAGLLLIALDIVRDYGKALDGAARETANLSRALDEQTHQTLTGVDRLITGVAYRAAESGSMSGALSVFEILMRDRLADQPQIASIWALDQDGRRVASTFARPSNPQVSPEQRDYFRQHRANAALGLHVGAPIVGQATGRRIVPISRGVWRDGRFLGVVVAGIDIDYLRATYEAIDVGRRGMVALVRLDGTPIVRVPARGDPADPAPAEKSLTYAAIANDPTGTLDLRPAVDGLRRIVSYRMVQDTGLVIAVGFSHTDVLADWYRTLWIEGAAAFALVMLGIVALLVLLRSLRQQRRIEDLRVETESLAHANEAKTAFLANMSHELRTPLNAVLGFAQLMEQEAFGPLGNRRYRDYVAEIGRSGDHLLRLLEGVLDMSAIDAARLTLDEKGFTLGRLLEDAQALAIGKARLRGVAVILQDGAPGTVIRADLRRMTHALVALLDNAVKVSPAGATVRFSASLTEGREVSIRITDGGPRMTAEDADLALRPWRQLNSTTTTRGEGSGLGLPLARSVAELHGGRLRFIVDEGPGATAELVLPADRVIAVAPSLSELPRGVTAAQRTALG